jgi:lipid-binding SYLF domain-containing protein
MAPFLRRHRLLILSLIFACAVLPAGRAPAATRSEIDEKVRRSGEAFRELREVPDRRVPAELFARSRCVAVIPNVIKAAWVFGGRYGKGVLSCRSKTGEWSPPVIVMMTGGSFGLQFGASSTDVVLFFMTTGSVRSLLSNKVKLSGDAGLAAGPIGRETEAATDGRFTAEIYSYARSRGLFAGVSLSGSYLGVDREDTDTYYGRPYTPTGILFDHKVSSVPKSAWSFLNALPRARAAAPKAAPRAEEAPAAPPPAPRVEDAPPARRVGPAGPPATEDPAIKPPLPRGPANRQLAPIVPPAPAAPKPKATVEKPAVQPAPVPIAPKNEAAAPSPAPGLLPTHDDPALIGPPPPTVPPSPESLPIRPPPPRQ